MHGIGIGIGGSHAGNDAYAPPPIYPKMMQINHHIKTPVVSYIDTLKLFTVKFGSSLFSLGLVLRVRLQLLID